MSQVYILFLTLGFVFSFSVSNLPTIKYFYASAGIYKVTKESCSRYLTIAAKVGSFLLQNNPWTGDSDGTTSDVQILCNLAGTILSDIKETEIGGLQLF